MAEQSDAAHSAHSIHFRLAFIAVTRYFDHQVNVIISYHLMLFWLGEVDESLGLHLVPEHLTFRAPSTTSLGGLSIRSNFERTEWNSAIYRGQAYCYCMRRRVSERSLPIEKCLRGFDSETPEAGFKTQLETTCLKKR